MSIKYAKQCSNHARTREEIRCEPGLLDLVAEIEAWTVHTQGLPTAACIPRIPWKTPHKYDGGRTIAEELVLLPVPDNQQCTVAECSVLARDALAPVRAPVSFDRVEGRLEGMENEGVCQPTVVAVVHLEHPGCR